MVTQEVNLNLIPGGVPPVVNVSQYDKGTRVLKLHLYLGQEEYEVPEGAVAFIQGTKPDGNGFLYICESEGNTIIADLADQMTVLPGAVRCEAFLQEDTDKRIGTANFVLLVERATLQDPEDHLSETEIPLIGTLAEAALKAMQSQKAAAASESNAKASETNASSSEKNASDSEKSALDSQNAAAESEKNAKASADAAAESEENAKEQAEAAMDRAEAAADSAADLHYFADTAKSYAVGGTESRDGEDTDNAKYYALEAKTAKETAESAKNAAAESKAASGKSEEAAAASAKAAGESQSAAAASEKNAKTSEGNAATSEQNAVRAEASTMEYTDQALDAMDCAKDSEAAAKSYAVGGTGSRNGEDTDNAKYYAAEAKNAAQEEKGNDLLEASGTSFVVNNSADALIHSLAVEGKSSQKKYSGYNLCGGEYFDQRWWAHKDPDLLAILNTLPVGTYRIMTAGEITSIDSNYDADTSGSLMYGIAVYASGSQYFSTQNRYSANKKGAYTKNSKTFEITEENKGLFTDFYQYTCGASKDGVHGSGNLWIMVTSGTSEKDYEPYVGGKASPNPDYPQEIESLDNPAVIFKSKNVLTNAGPFTFQSNAGPAILSKADANMLLTRFYGKNAYVSFDVEASSDFVTGDRNRFGLENTIKDASRTTYYGAFQLWFSGDALEAGSKKHFSGIVQIGKDIPENAEITDVDSVFFYVQCISSGSLTVSHLQMELADEESEYEGPKSQQVTIPHTLRSIGDTHDELIVMEDGTGTLIQRIWHRELAIADMNNSEDYPGWRGIKIREVVTGKNGPLKQNGISGYCSINADLSGIDMNTMGNNDIIFIGGIVSSMKQSEWKTAYPDLICVLDLPYINPVVTALTADEVATIIALQTYNRVTVVYAEDGENITLQYYNATVQGGQDQVTSLKKAVAAEIKRASDKESDLENAVSTETKRAGDAESKINETLTATNDKLTEDEKTLDGLHTGLGTMEVKSFTGKCLASGGFDVGRIATFPSYPLSLWITDKLEGTRSLVLSTHAYADGWFVNVADISGADVTDLELTIKALIATPA